MIGDRLMIRIVDRGPGIPYGELPRIFEPFYRGYYDGDAFGFRPGTGDRAGVR